MKRVQVLADNERWIGRQIEKIKLEKEKHKNEGSLIMKREFNV